MGCHYKDQRIARTAARKMADKLGRRVYIEWAPWPKTGFCLKVHHTDSGALVDYVDPQKNR